MIAIAEYTISAIYDGEKGEQGVSVSKVVTEWTKSTSSTALPSNPSWSETKPAITSGEYLWYRDRTDLNNGTSTYSNAVCDVVISGVLTDVDSINNKITNKVWESDITSKINQYDGSTVSTIRDRVTQTEQDITGITTRVSNVESETDDLGTRITSAESSITQNANNINLKVSKDSVISEINQSPESITISADKVNIEGATIFSTGRLSQTSLNNAYDAKGSAATAKTEAINSANSATDTKLQSYSTTSQMNTAIGTAVNNAVDDIEANAIKSTVSCYYRSTTNTTPTITKNTSIGTSNNTDNAWEYVMPVPKRNAYFFTCEKYTYMDDSVAFSTVRPLDSQTYASKWVSSSDNTYVDGGRIYTHSITTSQLATDAIKSNNYSASQNTNSPYSATGSFLDLSTGNFYTPNFGIDNTNGKAYLNGEIVADSGQIGSDSTNYWEIGTKTDYNANDSAAIIGHGSSYIQSGGWMISSDRIDTRSYDANRKYTYLNNNNTYWDFGLHVPNLTSTEVYENNFVYIRKHDSTIPTLESQWDYVFRIDRDGGIEATGLKINGTTIQDMITAGVDGGAYLPTSGGTISGNLTVTGTITGLKTLSINGKTYNGTSTVDVGVIGASYGGTGQSSLKASGTAILSALDTNTTTPVDSDYIATGSSTFYRKTMSKVWDYIKGKINADTDLYTDKFVLKTGGEFTGAITVSDSFTADEITTGNLIVNGAGRFTNGLYGDLTGNADTATKAAKVADSYSGSNITISREKAGLSTTSWIAAWDGYELRAISPANLLTAIGAQPAGSYVSKSGDTMTGNLTVPTLKVDSIINEDTGYTHRIDFGRSSFNQMNFYEYGGVYNFYKNTVKANTDSAVLLGRITANGWEGDVLGTAQKAVHDGSGNVITSTYIKKNDGIPESSLIWGDKFFTAGYSVGDAFFNDYLRANRLAGVKASAVSIEYSSDSGSTWNTYQIDDSAKRALFTSSANVYIGGSNSGTVTANSQVRITLDCTEGSIYTQLRKLMIYVSTNYSQDCKVTITASLGSSPNDYSLIVCENQSIAGWSGWNVIPCNFVTHGNSSAANSQYRKIRFVFTNTGLSDSSKTGGLTICRIYGYGGVGWFTPSNLALTGHVYTYDGSLNVTFPANVTATTFTGNATSASKLNSTRSFTIGKTAKNVDWSGAVSFSQAEISDNASTTAAGWMSKDDKVKLNGIETGAQVNTITGVKGNSESSYRTGNVNITASNIGLGNLTNDKQIKGLSSGTTSGHFVTWGSDGYTVADSGIAKGSVTTKITLSGTDYSASSNTITITKANLQSAVQDTSLVLMTSAERSKLSSIQVSEGGTIDFSGVTASAPLTATVNQTTKAVNLTHDTSGVTAGTYRSVTVNTYGHVTAGTNPTTLSGYGITDAKIASGVITLGSNTITPLTASSTLDATKLSGTASISTTGNAGTATEFSSNASVTLTGDTTGTASSTKGWNITTKTDRLSTVGDNRSVATTPNDYKNKIIFQGLKTNGYIGSPISSGYSYLIGLRGWSDNSGGNAHELAFNDDGIYRRQGATDTWENWCKLIDSSNYTDYTVTKTGSGASGTWGIGISGNATTATKFSSNRSIALTGDVTGSASSNGENGWSIATTVGDDSHNHTPDTIKPLKSKTFTDVIGSANNWANATFFYGSVKPSSWDGIWRIKYRIKVYVPNHPDYCQMADVMISGKQGDLRSYYSMNTIGSYYVCYYHELYRLKQAGFTNGYGHSIGVRFYSAYVPIDTNYKRTIEVEVYETENCTFDFYDSCLPYASISGTGTTNYNTYSEIDFVNNGLQETGDANDVNYYNREYYTSRITKNALYRYQLCVTDSIGQVIPINSVNNSVATNKTLMTDAFDPFGEIFYWASTSTYTAGANIGNGNLYRQYLADLRYSFNCGGYDVDGTLTARLPLYLVCTPQTDGAAKLHSVPLSQTLPTSDDGLIYIYLGRVYEDTKPYRVVLSLNHPIYWYKNGAVRPFVQRAENANIANSATNATNATYTNNLLAYSSNEVTIGANSATAGSSTNYAVYINYRDLNGGSTSNNSTAITDYYFGNRKGTVTGVEVHATTFNGNLTGNAATATKATQDGSGNVITDTYVNLTGTQTISGTKTFSATILSSAGICVNSGGSPSTGGVSFWSDKNVKSYGIALRSAADSGKHGYVQGDYAIYNYISAGTTGVQLTRGWVFKDAVRNQGVASISGAGNAVFDGSVTIGGNATNTTGCRQEYNSTLDCLEFIFN